MYHMNREQPQPAMAKAAGYVRAIMTVLFILYLLMLAYLTLFSDHYNRQRFFRSFNFVPFKTIINYLNAQINKDIIAYFGRIRTLIPATSGQRFGIIRTA
jgi:glycopeptide antibiotics resistance protein